MPRHLAIVRITHWLVVLSVIGLLISGTGILVSHPRLYWGETGAVGTPSLIDLPIPFIIGPSVWNRPFHFFFAWILVLTGLTYVAGGWKRPETDASWSYNPVQRLTYLAVVFVVFPGIIWTGLGMSFGITSVFPFLATAIGGFQSARTLHFLFVVLLLVFVAVHVTMVALEGFWRNVRAMITGYLPEGTRNE